MARPTWRSNSAPTLVNRLKLLTRFIVVVFFFFVSSSVVSFSLLHHRVHRHYSSCFLGAPLGDGTLYDTSGADVRALDPCLVEVGARCHGAEGFWMSVVEEAYYPHRCQTLLALDAYLPPALETPAAAAVPSVVAAAAAAAAAEEEGGGEASAAAVATGEHGAPVLLHPCFAAHPSPGPPPLVAHGRIKFLVFFGEGGILARPSPCLVEGLREILAMPTYRAHEIFASPGAAVGPTIDCFTWGGVVKLCGSEEDVRRDYDRIDALCADGLWNWV